MSKQEIFVLGAETISLGGEQRYFIAPLADNRRPRSWTQAPLVYFPNRNTRDTFGPILCKLLNAARVQRPEKEERQ